MLAVMEQQVGMEQHGIRETPVGSSMISTSKVGGMEPTKMALTILS